MERESPGINTYVYLGIYLATRATKFILDFFSLSSSSVTHCRVGYRISFRVVVNERRRTGQSDKLKELSNLMNDSSRSFRVCIGHDLRITTHFSQWTSEETRLE